MSYVILEKYNKLEHGTRQFLIGRTLRLYPCYWAVLLLTIAARIWLHQPTIYTSSLDLSHVERAIALFTNTFIFGLDIQIAGAAVHWHEVSSGGLDLSWSKMLIMQGWTIGAEITFYILAIFWLFRSKSAIHLALALGIYIRLYFLLINGKFLGFSHDGIGYSNLPWGYHFFGTILIYFMLGYLAYEIFKKMDRWATADRKGRLKVGIGTAAVAAVLLSLWARFDGLQTIADYNDYRLWSTLPFVVLLIPGLFWLTRHSRIDDFIGLFSYPIYLCHITAADVGDKLLPERIPAKWITAISVAIMALALVLLVERPMEIFRRNRLGLRIKVEQSPIPNARVV